ncbi:MAG: serine acetyltransferase [Bacteroides sp.]|nr:serine acetyltransferase [Roseburia sp.]MCM1346376.1 serine acetyltransferase [Bacteroides sp.]MCM1420411.1 serine acetyltransferase [Bacteroides sp.]
MSLQHFNDILTETVDRLAEPASYKDLFHQHREGISLPSGKVLFEIIDIARSVIFPGYYGNSCVNAHTLKYHLGVNVERLHDLLSTQIRAGLAFEQHDMAENAGGKQAEEKSCRIATEFISRLPEIRRMLATDVIAAYNGDPAAKSYGEIISCYPVIKTLTNYRIAHELLMLGVPLIPRILTEMAHSETGIDIHPGATIGEYFTIDHGTGVVIGETCVIGDNVKLYQGVTLGAKSFPLDEDGNPIKGIARHPILEDNVIVYSNATILGRITIGKGATIGGNIWVTEDVPANGRVVQRR